MAKKFQRPEFTAADVAAALRARHPAPAWAFLEAVRNGTGYRRQTRTADALAMSLFPSRGLHLHGFEIKVWRGDWLREVKDPEKAEAIAKYCHFWWVAAPPGVVDEDLAGPEIPTTWGYMRIDGGKATIVKEAKFMQAEPPDHLLLAAILRNCAAHEVDKARLDAAFAAGRAEGVEAGAEHHKLMVEHREQRHAELVKRVKTFEDKSGVQIDTYSFGDIGAAVRLLTTHAGGIKGRLDRLAKDARELADDSAKAAERFGAETKPPFSV